MQICGFRVRAIGKSRLLAPANSDSGAGAGRFPFAAPNRDYGFVIVGINVEAIVARLGDCECLVRSVHFIGLAIVQTAHMQVHRPLVELQLHRVLGDVGQGQAAFRIQPDESGA
jgi:hypothetical protein